MASTRILPPRSRASDQEALDFVATTKGAIGYVSAHFEVPAGVKVLTLSY